MPESLIWTWRNYVFFSLNFEDKSVSTFLIVERVGKIYRNNRVSSGDMRRYGEG